MLQTGSCLTSLWGFGGVQCVPVGPVSGVFGGVQCVPVGPVCGFFGGVQCIPVGFFFFWCAMCSSRTSLFLGVGGGGVGWGWGWGGVQCVPVGPVCVSFGGMQCVPVGPVCVFIW